MATVAGNVAATAAGPPKRRRALPPEASILLVLVGIALVFELLGWTSIRHQSFLGNPQRLLIMILQVSVIGIICRRRDAGDHHRRHRPLLGLGRRPSRRWSRPAWRRSRGYARAVYPSLTGMPVIVPIAGGPGRRAGGRPDQRRADRLQQHPALHRHARHDGDGARPRQVVHARPAGQHAVRPVTPAIGSGSRPVLIFVAVAICLPHRAALHAATASTPTPSAPTCRRRGSRASTSAGHLIMVYAIAGLLSGLAGVVTSARAASRPGRHGDVYELDAIAAAVIGGTSPLGRRRPDHRHGDRHADPRRDDLRLHLPAASTPTIQEIIKGVIIVAAVVADQYRNRRRK